MPSHQNVQRLNRRDFLKGTTALSAAATLGAFGAPAIIQAQTLTNPVNYGFIGSGRQGCNHLKHLSTISSGRCAVICDIYPPNLKKGVETIGNNPETVGDDYRRLLDRKDIEAVFIVTPYNLHVPMVLDAISAGKHVFVEKVMAQKEDQIPQVIAASEANPKQVLQVGLQRRYSKVYQVAMQMVHSGALGKVQFIRAQWNRNGSWRVPVPDPKLERFLNWRVYREYSGGLMAELGSHQVDVADWAFQSEPVSVVGVGGLDYWKDGRDIFDNVSVVFEYPQGQKFVFTSICNNAHLDFSEVIMGDEGTIEITLGNNSARATYYRENKPKDAPTNKTVALDSKEQNWWAGATAKNREAKKGFPIFPEFPQKNVGFVDKEIDYARKWLIDMGVLEMTHEPDALTVEEESFFNCVREGKQPLAGVQIGAADSRAVIYANQAMESGQKVFWPKSPATPKDIQVSRKGRAS
ncbi:MAG: Gfo/Idh/MocA family oxidoreductase [Terriglobia bacterium]